MTTKARRRIVYGRHLKLGDAVLYADTFRTILSIVSMPVYGVGTRRVADLSGFGIGYLADDVAYLVEVF